MILERVPPVLEGEDDYIRRGDLLKHMFYSPIDNVVKSGEFKTQDWAVRVSSIFEVPPVRVSLVVSGKWIKKPRRFGSGVDYICSICNSPAPSAWGHSARSNYCPDCGAKMEG